MLDILQLQRDLMAQADKKIREVLARHSPGEATALIFSAYRNLDNTDERNAFVSVLASRVAVAEHLREPF